MKRTAFALAISWASLAGPIQAQTMILPSEWTTYVENYVADDGRVIDTANNGISHSESQGYGLVLSALADDRATFERIWTFTSTQLMVRDDGLSAWLWDPSKTPSLVDANNATDGDILIAYGLALAGEAWDDTGFTDAARRIIGTVGRSLLVDVDGLVAILPGAEGFRDPEGEKPTVLNPSYWVFEALPVFAELDPAINWEAVSDAGVELIRRARVKGNGLPPDWLVLGGDGQVRPAPDFPAEFGYNGIRIPLYMMRAGINPVLLDPFRNSADEAGLYKVDAVTGEKLEPISEPGYRLIGAAMECVAGGTAIPGDLTTFSPTSYYAATLQLLLLDFLRRDHAECLGGTPS